MSAADLEWVYLARHGQTVWNTEGRSQGQLDSPLTPAGLLQAEGAADLVASMPVDQVFCSPLGRARTTAATIASPLGRPLEVVDDLREVHHGRLAGLTYPEIERDHPQELANRAQDKYGYRFPGGESYADVDRRAERALAQIRATEVRRPLIVAHEMINRMLLRALLDVDPQAALTFTHPNDVIYRIQVSEHRADQIAASGTTPFWPALQ